jgi:hypothetical protein
MVFPTRKPRRTRQRGADAEHSLTRNSARVHELSFSFGTHVVRLEGLPIPLTHESRRLQIRRECRRYGHQSGGDLKRYGHLDREHRRGSERDRTQPDDPPVASQELVEGCQHRCALKIRRNRSGDGIRIGQPVIRCESDSFVWEIRQSTAWITHHRAVKRRWCDPPTDCQP